MIHLDRKVVGLPGTLISGWTHWTLPYAVPVDGSQGEVAVVVDGVRLYSERPSATTVRVEGSHQGSQVEIGVRYDFVYKPTAVYLRDDGGRPVSAGRLQLRYLDTHLIGLCQVTKDLSGRSPSVTLMRVDGEEPGAFRIPIQAKNDTVALTYHSRSPLPVTLVALEWEGLYHTRARRA